MIPLISALGVLVVVAAAEWLHGRRVRVAERLAFGPLGARGWTRFVPFLRAGGLAAFAWGVMTLVMMENGGDTNHAKSDTATRVVFIGDLSPSMYLKDSGPEGDITRHDRMRDVVEGILQRVSGNLRFGVIGFYTESIPVVMEARDAELVRNVFNGLPLSYAMPEGKTDLGKAVNEALEHVAGFPPGSTRLVILTDGDSVSLVPIQKRPESVKEVLVCGVGNPTKGTYIDSHQSRQEGDTLQRLATALGGIYEDVNAKHLATTALGDLVVPLAPLQKGLSLAQLAVLAMVVGAVINAGIPVAQEYFGSAWRAIPA